ncbi:MAG TPA: hypothetical protein DCY27_00440 [Desulfobacterales bacterium]|nr:hypothetical protein [Desulfobacterales bacterium]
MAETRRLLRPHTIYRLVLKTPLAKQLCNVALGMANALAKLGLAVQNRLPPDQGKQAAALAFEILAGLYSALEADKTAAAGQASIRVTEFPAIFRKDLKVCHVNAVKVLNLLADLDNLAVSWHDQWFLGHLSQDDFNRQAADWKKRFRRASQQINNLMQHYLGGPGEQESHQERSTQTPFPYLHINR